MFYTNLYCLLYITTYDMSLVLEINLILLYLIIYIDNLSTYLNKYIHLESIPIMVVTP